MKKAAIQRVQDRIPDKWKNLMRGLGRKRPRFSLETQRRPVEGGVFNMKMHCPWLKQSDSNDNQ